jgi:hypothetical protein
MGATGLGRDPRKAAIAPRQRSDGGLHQLTIDRENRL